MTSILMLKTEPYATPTGSKTFVRGEVYHDVEQAIVNSFLGRGFATEVSVDDAGHVLTREDLARMNLPELKALAFSRKIPNANLLRKSDLLELLSPVGVVESLPAEPDSEVETPVTENAA